MNRKRLAGSRWDMFPPRSSRPTWAPTHNARSGAAERAPIGRSVAGVSRCRRSRHRWRIERGAAERLLVEVEELDLDSVRVLEVKHRGDVIGVPDRRARNIVHVQPA